MLSMGAADSDVQKTAAGTVSGYFGLSHCPVLLNSLTNTMPWITLLGFTQDSHPSWAENAPRWLVTRSSKTT